MKLEWMGEYRSLVEKFILFANSYAMGHNKMSYAGTSIKISASMIQTLEYIMENENLKMSEIAEKLGVTRSSFSKNVKKLEERGLLEKFRKSDNNKDVYVFITDFGKQVYKDYSKFIYELWFKEMFELADEIPREYLDILEDMLERFAHVFQGKKSKEPDPVYVPIPKADV